MLDSRKAGGFHQGDTDPDYRVLLGSIAQVTTLTTIKGVVEFCSEELGGEAQSFIIVGPSDIRSSLATHGREQAATFAHLREPGEACKARSVLKLTRFGCRMVCAGR